MWIRLSPSDDIGGMHNLDTGVAGESGLVEGENSGQAMNLHGRHEPGIVRRLPDDRKPHTQAVLLNRPCGDHPQLGRATTPRQEMKELYSAIEEAKADVTGLFMLQHLYDRKLIEGGPDKERQLYTTFLASTFRTLRFGLNDAHGKGMAMQVNYITDKGGFIAHPDGTFEVNFQKIKGAVRDLDHDLLTLEATGDYARTKQMLDQLGVIRPNMQKALKNLDGIPVDIQPVFVTANQLAPHASEPRP